MQEICQSFWSRTRLCLASDFQHSRIAQGPCVQLPCDLESRGDRRLSSRALAGSKLVGWRLRRCDRCNAVRSQRTSRPGEILFWENFAKTVRHDPNRPGRLSESPRFYSDILGFLKKARKFAFLLRRCSRIVETERRGIGFRGRPGRSG